LNYILFYKTPSKDKPPKTKDEPSEHIRLDQEFSYKLVQKIDKRIIVTGLIPKTKKFTNTMAIGPEYDEWLLQFDKEEDMVKWIQKTRKRCKRLRKAKLALQGVDTLELIGDIQRKVPINSPALQVGPDKEYKEEEWINIIDEFWQLHRNSKRELTEISLFGEFFSPENARYLSWFTSPGAAESSLERELLAAEDIFVLSWKLKFLDFVPFEKRIEEEKDKQGKMNLIQHCKYMMHLIDMHNKYDFVIHCKDEDYIPEKNKWDLFIQRLEGLIDEEEMRQLQSEKEDEERKKNLEKQVENERVLLQAQDDARKNDPFSAQNLYKEEEDPFQDIMLLEVVDIYGNLEGEVWTQAEREKEFAPPLDDDEYYNNLLKELDIDLDLDYLNLEGNFQLPLPSNNQKKTNI